MDQDRKKKFAGRSEWLPIASFVLIAVIALVSLCHLRMVILDMKVKPQMVEVKYTCSVEVPDAYTNSVDSCMFGQSCLQTKLKPDIDRDTTYFSVYREVEASLRSQMDSWLTILTLFGVMLGLLVPLASYLLQQRTLQAEREKIVAAVSDEAKTVAEKVAKTAASEEAKKVAKAEAALVAKQEAPAIARKEAEAVAKQKVDEAVPKQVEKLTRDIARGVATQAANEVSLKIAASLPCRRSGDGGKTVGKDCPGVDGLGSSAMDLKAPDALAQDDGQGATSERSDGTGDTIKGTSTGPTGKKTDDTREALLQKAKAGDAAVKCQIARRFLQGDGCERDLKTAFDLYRESAELGNAQAQWSLGYMYHFGYGCEKDDKAAVVWYRKSADQGNAIGQWRLGYMCEYGNGCEKDEKAAFKWYRKSAEQGDAAGQWMLGYMYQSGKGCNPEAETAFAWYQKSAGQNNAIGQGHLAKCLWEGFGCTRNIVEAIRLSREAAKNGSGYAANEIGYDLRWGRNCDPNEKVAYKLFACASDAGHVQAMNNLAEMLELGLGCDAKDEKKAYDLYLKAADKGCAESQRNLGRLDEFGLCGRMKSLDEAEKWYLKAIHGAGNFIWKDGKPVLTNKIIQEDLLRLWKKMKKADE